MRPRPRPRSPVVLIFPPSRPHTYYLFIPPTPNNPPVRKNHQQVRPTIFGEYCAGLYYLTDLAIAAKPVSEALAIGPFF